MVHNKAFVINIFPEFFLNPSYRIHPVFSLPRMLPKNIRGLGDRWIGLNQLIFFLISLISRLFRAVQNAAFRHSRLPVSVTLDCLPRGRKKRPLAFRLPAYEFGVRMAFSFDRIPCRLHSVVSGVLRYPVCSVGKVLDVNLRGLPLTLPLPLNQAETFQFPHERCRLVVATADTLLDLRLNEVDVHPALRVDPAVFGGKPHPVQQQAVKGYGFHGEAAIAGQEGLGDTEKAGRKTLGSVEVIQLVCHLNFLPKIISTHPSHQRKVA